MSTSLRTPHLSVNIKITITVRSAHIEAALFLYDFVLEKLAKYAMALLFLASLGGSSP